ncbi:MAG: sodium/glutamate symporter [Alphaproteobacteria bacterium]|nr:sodium/glutamate symporter [Alphaproteobacteria bacterium]
MTLALNTVQTLLAACLLLAAGAALNRIVPVLARYNIPEPITGGILFALLTLALAAGDITITFDPTLRGPFLLAFFATIGLSADLAMLKQGGPRLVRFLLVAAPFVAVQNVLGIAVSRGLDLHPLMGLIGGSLTLVGGPGTGAAYAQRFAEVNNIRSVMEITMASATFGLVIGGIIGGPVAQYLIRGHKLAVPSHSGPDDAATSESLAASAPDLLWTIGLIAICLVAGQAIAQLVNLGPVTLPDFLWCLFVGIFLRNVGPRLGLVRINQPMIDAAGTVLLSLFLAMTMMALRLWELAGLAGPLAVLLLAQTVLMVIYAVYVSFPAMGRTYESAVIAGGLCGFAMGATATAIANMQAVTRRYGPAPEAFLIVPLTGAFFIDVVNAIILTGYLSLPWFAL